MCRQFLMLLWFHKVALALILLLQSSTDGNMIAELDKLLRAKHCPIAPSQYTFSAAPPYECKVVFDGKTFTAMG